MPAATAHTAMRRRRSQSPPSQPGRFVQRRPVTTMQTAIASSSISPYMWMSTGPSSKKPVSGDGIDAITRGILPIAGRGPRREGLEEDLQREVRWATALEQPDRKVEVDVLASRKPPGRAVAVTGALQLLGSPELDLLLLCVLEDVEFGLAQRITS